MSILQRPLNTSTFHGLCLIGEALEAQGKRQEAVNLLRTALVGCQSVAGEHPILGKLSCSLGRALMYLDGTRKSKLAAATAFHHSFQVYDTLYATKSSEILVPAIVMGKAEEIGHSLGQLSLGAELTRSPGVAAADNMLNILKLQIFLKLQKELPKSPPTQKMKQLLPRRFLEICLGLEKRRKLWRVINHRKPKQ